MNGIVVDPNDREFVREPARADQVIKCRDNETLGEIACRAENRHGRGRCAGDYRPGLWIWLRSCSLAILPPAKTAYSPAMQAPGIGQPAYGLTTPAAECFPAGCIGGRPPGQARYKGQDCRRRNLPRYPSIGTGTMRPEGEKPHVAPGIGGLPAKPPRMAAPTLPRRFPSWHASVPAMVAGMRWREREQQHSDGRGNGNRSMHELTSHSRRSGNAWVPAMYPAQARSLGSMVNTRWRPISSTLPNARPRAPGTQYSDAALHHVLYLDPYWCPIRCCCASIGSIREPQ